MPRFLWPLALALTMSVAAAPAVFGCSTGASQSVEAVAAASRLIVLADVIAAPAGGLRYRLRVIHVIRGAGVESGSDILIGPASASPATFPDCWLNLPVGIRAVIALPDPKNLDALTSYAWWEEAGHLVTASPVTSSAGTIAELLNELRAAVPPDTATAPPVAAGRSWGELIIVVLGALIIGTELLLHRRLRATFRNTD